MSSYNILMIGGRRAGKTSVLASMVKCFKTAIKNSNLVLNTGLEKGSELHKKINELYKLFNENDRTEPFPVDESTTRNSEEYKFELKVAGKKSKYSINFIDIPGEWLYENPNSADIEKYVNESEIIIIAIDTPYLMEEMDEKKGYGKYHEEYNRVFEITEFVTNKLDVGEADNAKDRMVMFVPLKCEKYYNAGHINEVNIAIKKGYEELFDYLSKPNVKKHIAVAILPILTIRNIEFLEFKELSNSERPVISMYIFNPHIKVQECVFDPKYCEQPVIYILQYILNKVKNPNPNLLDKLKIWFLNLANDKDFQTEIENLKEDMIENKDGYETLQSFY
jgi:hypothetical protein